MNLKQLSNHALVLQMQGLVKSERKMTHLILTHILEIQERKLYAEMGYDSLFSYLTKYFGYCESSAYRRIQSARLLKQVPALASKIESGTVNLSQLTQIQKCIKNENSCGAIVASQKTIGIVEKIENKNSFETLKVLSQEFNQAIQKSESTKPQQDGSVRLEIVLTTEEYEILKKAKSSLSHVCSDNSWGSLFVTMAKKQIRVKSEKPHQGEPLKTSTTQSFASEQKYRPYMGVKIKSELFKKADHCCEFQNPHSGQKCKSTYQLEIDHVRPLALGGDHDVRNLRVLCRTHNQLMAQKSGIQRQKY